MFENVSGFLVFYCFSCLNEVQGVYAGSEPTHLDLEKPFLLSDSVENLNFYGKIEISEPEKNRKIQKFL